MGVTGQTVLDFLAWNLLLAWIPLVLAAGVGLALLRSRYRLALASGIVWLLFLPNAPYIATDFVHVRTSTGSPVWVNAVVIGCFAVSGLLLGFGALYAVHESARLRFGSRAAWCLAIGAATVSAVGIELGRMHALNSWDAIVRPGLFFARTLPLIFEPIAHWRGLVASAALAALLAATYAIAYFVTRRRGEQRHSPARGARAAR
jgi:uncharacterized membrane protein